MSFLYSARLLSVVYLDQDVRGFGVNGGKTRFGKRAGRSMFVDVNISSRISVRCTCMCATVICVDRAHIR